MITSRKNTKLSKRFTFIFEDTWSRIFLFFIISFSFPLLLINSSLAKNCTPKEIKDQISQLDKNKIKKQQTIKILESCNSSAVNPLITELKSSKKTAISQGIVEVLQKIKLSDLVIKQLIQELDIKTQNDDNVRSYVMKILVSRASKDEQPKNIAKALAKVLIEPGENINIRNNAATSIKEMGEQANSIVEELNNLLKTQTSELKDHPEILSSTVKILENLGLNKQTTISTFQEIIENNYWESNQKYWDLQISIINALETITEELEAKIQTLLKQKKYQELEIYSTQLKQIQEDLKKFKTKLEKNKSFPNAKEGKESAENLEAEINQFLRMYELEKGSLSNKLWQWLTSPSILGFLGWLLLVILLIVGYLFVLRTKPLILLKLPAEFSFSIPNTSINIKIPIGAMLWLKYQPEVMDNWVKEHLPKVADIYFQQKNTFREREIHIDLSVTLDDKELISPLTGDNAKLREIFSQNPCYLLIKGEGGTGKTSLACQIAKWMMESDDSLRPSPHQMLPVLIEEVNPIIGENKPPFDGLIESIRGELKSLNQSEPVSRELVENLLRHQRILVIVDRYSEMLDPSQQQVCPSNGDFPVNALIITSRSGEKFKNLAKITIRPEKINAQQITDFIKKYLEKKNQQHLWNNNDEFQRACNSLHSLVSQINQTDVKVWLTRIHAEQMIKVKQGIGKLPDNIPDLLREYLEQLNSEVLEDKRREPSEVYEIAKIIAWECLRHYYRPIPAEFDDVVESLKRFELEIPKIILPYLREDLKLLQSISNERIRFTLDPFAEYLAGLYLVDSYRNTQDQWRDFLKKIDELEQESSSSLANIKNFLLAVWNCCLVKKKEKEIPQFVIDKLGEKAGLDPKALKQAQHQQIIQDLILDLRSGKDRERIITAIKRLEGIGLEAKGAIPDVNSQKVLVGEQLRNSQAVKAA